ncbi:murein hydrolase activator EnvC family protein [Motiliproteus sediminis]|uniref:murein hydrolase activator EnvC family protein n=1 Tax=Motiliproteus sediminis TaxID=1468178 RepID=UPI001AEF6065|nr:peptidoglycan DD-metalloendopeptidase family protein [Motiliproteus sediminis]
MRILLPLIVTLLALQLPFAQAADADATQRQIRQLQSEIKQLRAELDKASGEQQSLQQALRRAESEAGRVSRHRDALSDDLLRIAAQLERLGPQQQRLQAQRKSQAEALGEQLALAFRSGQQDKLKLLLNQEKPERVSRLLHYHRYFTEARVAAIQQFNATLAELERTEATLKENSAALVDRQQQLEQRERELAGLRRERQQALASLQRDIKGRSEQLARLEQDQQRLQRVLRQLQQALAKADLAITTQRFAQLKGRLAWPTQGKVVERFGSRRGGARSEGIVIGAGAGQRVSAVHNGRVVYSDWLRGYGLLLIIDHGDGYMSLYGHNQSLLKEVGDWVAAGDSIAKVGDSGGREDAGLYFAIRRRGKPQNPQTWLRRG